MEKRLLVSIALLAILPTIYSCYCDCQCSKDLGCAILTVRKVNGMTLTNTVITTKMFCSQTDYYTDQALQDSVLTFKARYNTDTSKVDVKDSIYQQYDRMQNVKCGGTDKYISQGYGCSCAK